METAQLAEPDKAVLVDVGDNEADGVHVGGKHDLGALALLADNQVAQSVPLDLVGVGRGQRFDGVGDTGLSAWSVLRISILLLLLSGNGPDEKPRQI